MKFRIAIACILLVALAGIAAADSESAAAQVAVTDVSIDPGVLMRGDTGTVTVEITNNGQESVAISRAMLYSSDLSVQNDQAYASVGAIGAGNTMKFTFTVRADCADAITYPRFYLDFRDAGSLQYSVPVKVESSDIVVSILDAPDSFSAGNKEQIKLTVGNPRDATVTGVVVTAAGEGIETTQSSVFVGDLAPGASAEVTFKLIPSQETDITFTAAYRNGINSHASAITLPVVFGDDKLDAELVLNSIEVEGGSTYTLSADVTNAGLSDAYSIVVTVGDPADPCDPNPVYVIGALEPDDFSSFEVTFTARGASSVPVLVEYKDADGNMYEETFTVSLNGASASSGDDPASSGAMPAGNRPGGMGMMGFGSGLSKIPVTQIALVMIAGIVLVVGWRRGWAGKIRAKIRRKQS